MSNWIHIGTIEDIPSLGARVVLTEYGQVAVFRTADDTIFALVDRCPHQGGPLSQGIVHDQTVTCPLHNWRINLANGEAVYPDAGCTESLVVQVDNNGQLFIALPH